MKKQKIVGTGLSLFLLTGCATKQITLDYPVAATMPGYGYIMMDFRKGNELAYGRSYVKGKANYTIMYANGGKALFVDVKNAPFDTEVLSAYIPYYEGYQFRNVSRLIFLEPCETCGTSPRSYFVNVYATPTNEKIWCQETIHKNGETFNYEDGCPRDWRDKNGISGMRKVVGDVYITPYFNNDTTVTFTNRPAPVRASVGS